MNQIFSLASSLALAVTLSTAPLHALAVNDSVRVAVEVKDIKIELIDLTPDDGNTPWIQFTVQRNYGTAWGGRQNEAGSLSGPGEVTIGSNGNSVTVGSLEDRVWAHHELVAGQYSRRFTSSSELILEFDVSPWTSVRFSALGSIDGDRTGAASFHANLSFAQGLDTESHGVEYRPRLNQTGEWTMTRVISSGATQLGGSARARVWAETYVGPAPVPEPSTYAMLLAGIGIVGAAVRRKQRC